MRSSKPHARRTPTVHTRAHDIDGRQVRVYDGLLPATAIAGLWDVLLRAPYTRSEVARPDTAEYRHWVSELPLEQLRQLPVLAPTLRALADFSTRAYRPYRAYVNSAQYGDMLFSHVDCAPDAGEVTALWYLCDHWDHEWGGETVFFDATHDARALVAPRPGRLVLFDGDLPHVGRPPNRTCYKPRFTFAIKFEPVG